MKQLTFISLAAVGLGVASQALAGELLVNGGFENEPFYNNGLAGDGSYTLLSGSNIPGWTIEAGHGATVHNTNTYPTISGKYSVNMDGEGYNQNNADLYQDFSTVSGGNYDFKFKYQGWQNVSDALLSVSIVDLTTSSVIYSGSFGFDSNLISNSSSLVGTGNQWRLRVKEAPQSGYNDNKFMVDDFSVIETVPEPASMLALGLGAVALLRKRNKKA